jgi:hypothetical protein
MNYKGVCAALMQRLAEFVPADDPMLLEAKKIVAHQPPQFEKGAKNKSAVLTPDMVRELRQLRREGWSYGRLAIRFGISSRHACRIASNKAWSWMDD